LQNSMGAIDTLAFRSLGAARYRASDGRELGRDEMFHILRKASVRNWYLVQPWLKNHPSIADFAVDSLVTIRVVTCLNEAGAPEVTLAMLRVLAKLEPTWTDVPDEEYATPIDLATGRMGLFTGDSMRTSHLRYDKHLVTGRQIEGTVLEEWPAIRDLAIRVHAAFPYRVLIGWDIALTDKGPVVLEGNNSLDVMFLQRVHDTPAGRTRMGELLNYHLRALEAERVGMGGRIRELGAETVK
ncbi:MAG: sugar-transfer associated ATP-grasp domain-containing protein, partial [Aestuariivirga sp.]